MHSSQKPGYDLQTMGKSVCQWCHMHANGNACCVGHIGNLLQNQRRFICMHSVTTDSMHVYRYICTLIHACMLAVRMCTYRASEHPRSEGRMMLYAGDVQLPPHQTAAPPSSLVRRRRILLAQLNQQPQLSAQRETQAAPQRSNPLPHEALQMPGSEAPSRPSLIIIGRNNAEAVPCALRLPAKTAAAGVRRRRPKNAAAAQQRKDEPHVGGLLLAVPVLAACAGAAWLAHRIWCGIDNH